MRLRYVAVYGLFGSYDNVIELNGDGLTFIHSLNGMGKSMTLRLICMLFDGDEEGLLSIPFLKMDLEFDDGTIIFVDRRNGLQVRISKNEVDLDTTVAKVGEMYDVLYLSAERNVTYGKDSSVKSTINVLQDDINGRLSSSSDNSEITIGEKMCEDLGEEEFINRCRDIKAKMDFIEDAGIRVKLPSDIRFPPKRMEYSENKEKYRKLAASLSDWIDKNYLFAESLVTYLDIINSMFTNKKIAVNDRRRLTAVLNDGNTISLDRLSAGEKQLMIIFYELLFLTHPDMTVIIDEPEISLHVGWQQKLCSLFLDISRIRKIDLLVATHSPQIIHDRWDLAQELGADHA
jgi:hypothetical protein